MMISFIIDLVRFPFESKNHQNKVYQLLQFLIKDYPAYLREKPSMKKILQLPLLVIYLVLKKK